MFNLKFTDKSGKRIDYSWYIGQPYPKYDDVLSYGIFTATDKELDLLRKRATYAAYPEIPPGVIEHSFIGSDAATAHALYCRDHVITLFENRYRYLRVQEEKKEKQPDEFDLRIPGHKYDFWDWEKHDLKNLSYTEVQERKWRMFEDGEDEAGEF